MRPSRLPQRCRSCACLWSYHHKVNVGSEQTLTSGGESKNLESDKSTALFRPFSSHLRKRLLLDVSTIPHTICGLFDGQMSSIQSLLKNRSKDALTTSLAIFSTAHEAKICHLTIQKSMFTNVEVCIVTWAVKSCG